MRLLIDIGNTRIKWFCVSDDDQSVCQVDFSVQEQAVAHKKSFSAAFEECFGLGSGFSERFSATEINAVYVSNVAGDLAAQALSEYVVNAWRLRPVFAQVERKTAGIKNSYEVLSELGVDRWMAVIGARQVFSKGHVIVINCGTAITVDVLSADDCFLGGAILPGFQLASESLSHADGIAKIQPSRVEKVVGVRTSECVQLGVLAACIGGVERMVDKVKSKLLNESVNILISGGAAELFLSESTLECKYDANIIIRGLNRVIK